MKKELVARLALRVEGDWWVAYLAQIGTMEGAEELGRTRMSIIEDPDMKASFMAFMKVAMQMMIEASGNRIDGWHDPVIAPQHEKAGRA